LAKDFFFDWLKPRIPAVLAIGKKTRQYWQHHFGSGFSALSIQLRADNQFFSDCFAQ